MEITLYHYWRSSSSWRVRWALSHKNIFYKEIAVNLLNGESESETHLKRHPLGFVPVMELEGKDGKTKRLIESVAMIEFLEETFPANPLLPKAAFDRATVRALTEIITADTQPLQNLSALEKYSNDSEKRKEWAQYFITTGLGSYEKLIEATSGKFSFGDQLTLADLVLIPQCYNATRFDVSLSQFPKIEKINAHCLSLPSCVAAHPDRFQPKELK